MKIFSSINDPEVTRILTSGGIGVLRTDTIYGVVGRADDESAVRRIYQLKGRDDDKSPIVLIDDQSRVYDQLSEEHMRHMLQVWPGKVSVIVPSKNAPTWVRRGNDSVAYRLPESKEIQALLGSTGPLIAPSANPQGMQPAMNLREAIYYFGEKVDFYVDGGAVDDPTPSQIIRLEQNGEATRLR